MEYNADQVEIMRSEITDEEFMIFISKHPGCTWNFRRPIVLVDGSWIIKDTTFYFEEDNEDTESLGLVLGQDSVLRRSNRDLGLVRSNP